MLAIRPPIPIGRIPLPLPFTWLQTHILCSHNNRKVTDLLNKDIDSQSESNHHHLW